MKKSELVKILADHRIENTPHKDRARWYRALNKMTKRELETVAKFENLI